MKCLRMIMGYTQSTPRNVITESKVPLLKCRFKILGTKFLVKRLSQNGHTVIKLLEEIQALFKQLLYENNFEKIISQVYENLRSVKDIIHLSDMSYYFMMDIIIL